MDDYSYTTWLFLLRTFSELLAIFKLFYKEVQIQYGYHLLTLRFDNASKYIQSKL